MNKRSLAAALCAGFAFVASAADNRPSDSLERSFAEGGRIRLDLSAGDYTISGSADAKLHVEWSVKEASQLKEVRVNPKLTGSEAVVEVQGRSCRVMCVVTAPWDWLDADIPTSRTAMPAVFSRLRIEPPHQSGDKREPSSVPKRQLEVWRTA